MTKKQKQCAVQCKWKSEQKNEVKWKRNRYLGRRRYITYKPLHKLRQRIKLKISTILLSSFFLCRFSTLTHNSNKNNKKNEILGFSPNLFTRCFGWAFCPFHHMWRLFDCLQTRFALISSTVISFLQSQQHFFCSLSHLVDCASYILRNQCEESKTRQTSNEM